MDHAINLTIALGGYFYLGSLKQWHDYARVLTAGKIAAYRHSPAYGNQSLQSFFEFFIRTWKRSTPPPHPEECGLIPLRPENLTQSQIINALLRS